MWRASKALTKGIGKSRKGRPTISLQTLIDRTKQSAFFGELHKLAEPVTRSEAAEARKVLTETPRQRVQKHLEAGILPAIGVPAFRVAGTATKALVDAKKGRLSAAGKALKATTTGDIVSGVIGGAGLGTTLSLGREGLQIARAKDTYEDFLRQHRRKRKH